MSSDRNRRRYTVIAAAIVLAATPIHAQESTAADTLATEQPPRPLSWDVAVRRLMNQGNLDRAETVIERRLAIAPKDAEAKFLKGMIALARGNNRLAIRQFRSILIDQPNATRVRLELARAFYLDKDYGNAVRQFQFALAGKPPPEVVANIDRYMAAIREAKSLSYNFGIALAPDSNLNTGSSAREVTLFGLPFDLSDEARQRSGVGIALEAGGEWAPRIGKSKRLRLGLSGQRREYKGSEFDDMSLAAYAGPRFVSGKWDLSLLGTGYKRWFGSKPYNHSAGVRIEATRYETPRLVLSGSLSAQKVGYYQEKERDGPLVSVSAGGYYALTPSSGAALKGGVSRQDARLPAFSNWSGFVATGFSKDLPLGFSIYIEPSFSMARYDEELVGFGRKRVDRSKSLLVTILNRHLVLTRFTPRLSYTITHQNSSIPLYDFKRNRVELGLTTVF